MYRDLYAFFESARFGRIVAPRSPVTGAFSYCTCPDGKQCNSCK